MVRPAGTAGGKHLSEWKKTGTPAHNNAQRRSEGDYVDPVANPDCMACSGKGVLPYRVWDSHNEMETYDIDVCPCTDSEWRMMPDKSCTQCGGTGTVQERLLVKERGAEEQVVHYYDCVCLRYIELRKDEDGEGEAHHE